MTPYVVHNNEEVAVQQPQKPKSIMVGAANGGLSNGTVNGGTVPPPEEAVDTPDSLPSRSSVSGRSIIGNGKNGRSGALKRVSFGSSKGSMVETLVYDHQEDLAEVPSFLVAAPVTNGEESRVHPAKVRVKFIESQQVAQVTCAPPSPDVTLEFGSDTMTSPTSEHSPDYHRQMSHESGIDNPFRPDGELSREADTIVSLIKEGKPITPQDHPQTEEEEPTTMDEEPQVQQHHQTTLLLASNGVDRTDSNGKAPPAGVVEVQRGVIAPPAPSEAVEQVVIKKKPKCHCCTIQ